MTHTIYALSSAPGKAGVSIVRVSGEFSHNSLKLLINKNKIPEFRKSTLLSLRDPFTKEIIDNAVVIAFQGPHSFTGENVVEYHLHGSPAVIQSLFASLSKMDNHRMALPGEFTKRAFENGKLDLIEAEAVADLINAETQAQKLQALSQMGGALSNLYQGWAEKLTRILAYTEAVIDFADDEVPDDEIYKRKPEIEVLIQEIEAHLNDNRRGERLREGIKVAVIGAPNAGKSSLVNALAQREIAIVSDLAGTTRDVIEVPLNIAGYPVILYDTAGLRPDQLSDKAQDQIESEGIKRALKIANEADIRLLLFDGTQDQPDRHTFEIIDKNSVVVLNKNDMFHVKQRIQTLGFDKLTCPIIDISVLKDNNMDKLLKTLETQIANFIGNYSSQETLNLTRLRHRENVFQALGSLQSSLNAPLPELIAEDLRIAIRHLGRITGRVDVEDLLDVIFRDFCIGK